MSEQTTNYMAQLDGWTESTVIGPLFSAAQDFSELAAGGVVQGVQHDWEKTVEQVKLAIRKKVLESYRNGQASKATPPAKKEWPQRKPVRRGV
jgi:hypothetical protein